LGIFLQTSFRPPPIIVSSNNLNLKNNNYELNLFERQKRPSLKRKLLLLENIEEENNGRGETSNNLNNDIWIENTTENLVPLQLSDNDNSNWV
jgi:hypothetical protein